MINIEAIKEVVLPSRNIIPMPVIRDEYGFYSNKTWSKFLDCFGDSELIPNDVWYEALNGEGIQTAVIMFEDDADEELTVEFYETENWVWALSQWNPKPPTKDYFLVSIHDTDYGPCAVFVKYVD